MGDKTLPILSKILKGLLLAYVAIFGFINLSNSQKRYGEKAPKPELYGMLKITHFETKINMNLRKINDVQLQKDKDIILSCKGIDEITKITHIVKKWNWYGKSCIRII